MDIVALVYRETAGFPRAEIFGLTNQLRRAAVSIPSNIAEGAARASDSEFAQYLSIALGSLAEVETQLEVAVELGYIAADSPAIARIWRAGVVLKQLRKSVAARNSRSNRPPQSS